MPVSMAQQRATAKFKKNNYDRMEVLLAPKGRKAELQAHVTEQGESLNKFVNRAIDETMERDTQAQEPSATVSKNATVEESSASTTPEPTVNTNENQTKPTGKPSQELIETWLTLSNSGLGVGKIELMPESGGFKQTTIKKYLRLAREGQADERGEGNAQA